MGRNTEKVQCQPPRKPVFSALQFTMMKLSLSLTLLWMLVSTAGALQCQTCVNPADLLCTSTVAFPCLTETECVAATLTEPSLLQTFKLCAPSSVCPAPGNQALSLSTSSFYASVAAQCCNTDNCNTVAPAGLAVQTVNSLKCYTCDSANSNCSTQIQCKGVENRCFRANMTSGTTTSLTLGCASANMCGAASSLGSLPTLGSLSNITCCGTSLCNSAPPAATTTIYFLLGLVVFSLY